MTSDELINPVLTNLTEDAAVAQLNSADVQLDLPEDSSPPLSFVGNIQTDDDSNSPAVIDDFQIDLGSDVSAEARVDESQLGSFLKNLPN